MVVLHSPKQSHVAGSRGPDRPGISTSPLALGALNVNAAAAAPGYSYASPTNVPNVTGMPLDKRIAETLSLVAADSPNTKENAPWPFASSSKLRRSPPGSAVRNARPVTSARLAGETHHTSPSLVQALSSSRHATAQTVQPSTRLPGQRSFEVAAKALFDDRRTRPVNGRRSSPPPTTLPALDAPISLAKNLKPRASLPESSSHRSAPLLSTLSQLSLASGSPSRSTGSGTPHSVQSLAKIGRLSARIAHLESLVTTTQSEGQTWETKYVHAVERYEREKLDREETQAKLDEYVALADACQEILSEYEELKAANAQLEAQHEEDQNDLVASTEAFAKLKWKEKKVRCELASRRQEGKWQELTEHGNEVRNLRQAKIVLAMDKVELATEVACMRAEVVHLQQVAQSAQAEVGRVIDQRKTEVLDSQDHRIKLDLAAEQSAKHHEERTELIARLEEAIRSREQYEKINKGLTRQVELLESKDDIESKERDNKVRELKIKLREAEEKLKASETENGKLDVEKEELQARLEDKEADLQLLKTQAKELDKKLRTSEEERQNLQTGINMQQRAARAFASPAASATHNPSFAPSASAASQALIAAIASPLGKRKRAPQITEEDEEEGRGSPSDAEMDESIQMPPPLGSRPVARGTSSKGKGKVRQESEQQAEMEEKDGKPVKPAAPKRRKVVREEPENAPNLGEDGSDVRDKDTDEEAPSEKMRRARKGSKQPKPAKLPTKQTKGKRKAHVSDDEVEPEKVEVEATKPRRAKEAKASAPALGSVSDDDADTAPPRPSGSGKPAVEKGKHSTSLLEKDSNRQTSSTTSTGKEAAKKTTVATAAEGKRASTSGGKKKLNTAGSSTFVWGTGAAAGASTSKTVLGLPDILSPLKRH